MSLIRVELVRLASRRTTWALFAVSVALTAVLAGSAAFATRSATPTEQATAEQLRATQAQLAEAERRECLRDPTAFFGPDAVGAECEEIRPTVERFLARPALDLGAEVDNRGLVLAVLLTGLALLLGALVTGADWSGRLVGHQLLHEPRRGRLWVSKAGAVVVAATVTAIVSMALFWGALQVVATARGITTAGTVWGQVLDSSMRGIVLVAATALGAFALTMLLRSTAAPLVLVLGYAVVTEGLTASLPFDRMGRWSLPPTVLAWLRDGIQVPDAGLCSGVAPARCQAWYEIGASHAAAYLGTLLVLAVATSVLSFRWRDV